MLLTVQDIRYACRQLRRSPGFAVIAIATLALGIGANTAMFTVVESVLLRPLAYPDSKKLVAIEDRGSVPEFSLSFPAYREIREQAQTLTYTVGYTTDVGVVQTHDTSLSIVIVESTRDLFRMLGTTPLRGRTFTEKEASISGSQTVIVSEGLWRDAFGADPAMIGRAVRINGQPRTVIGIMPRKFRFPESAGDDIRNAVWLPLQRDSNILNDPNYRFLSVVAMIGPRTNLPDVQTELGILAGRLRNGSTEANRQLRFYLVPYLETITGPVHSVFLSLLAALGLVLLIGCANVANLLIARSLGRRHEFAVRTALGCGQRRLITQIVIEAGVLSLFGSAAGLLLANWVVSAVHALPSGTIPRADEIQLHWTVIVVTGAIAALTTLLSALLPALMVTRTDSQSVLRSASRVVGAKTARTKVGWWLVSGEVALSAVLLVAAALLFRTLWNLEHARFGFAITGITSFTAMPADASAFAATSEKSTSVATTVYSPLLQAMRRLPGVRGAELVTAPPFSGIDLQVGFRIPGLAGPAAVEPKARLTAVSGGYARLMGTPLIRGRELTEYDTVGTPLVATVNQMFAKQFLPGSHVLGQQLDLGGKEIGMAGPYAIVGVIADQLETGSAAAPQPLVMLPYQQIPSTSLFYPALLQSMVHFVVKTEGELHLAPAARALFHRIAPDLALDNFETMQDALDRSDFGARISLYLIASFAGLAVLMVMAGLYGVLAQIVSQRQREFGVRMALGATRQSIISIVLTQAGGMLGLGLTVGFLLALAASGLIKGFLYGVAPLDTVAHFSVLLLLLVVGLIAGFIPACRAASSESVKALRDG